MVANEGRHRAVGTYPRVYVAPSLASLSRCGVSISWPPQQLSHSGPKSSTMTKMMFGRTLPSDPFALRTEAGTASIAAAAKTYHVRSRRHISHDTANDVAGGLYGEVVEFMSRRQ